jgi:hypothetical protein
MKKMENEFPKINKIVASQVVYDEISKAFKEYRTSPDFPFGGVQLIVDTAVPDRMAIMMNGDEVVGIIDGRTEEQLKSVVASVMPECMLN